MLDKDSKSTKINSQINHLIREHFQAMDGYVSAGMESNKAETKVFMNANENPFSIEGLEGFNYYPEPQPVALLEALSKIYQIAPSCIAMTRGADESIVLLTRLFCEPYKDAVLITPPTFGMYAVNANATPVEIVKVPLISTETSYCLDTKNIINKTLESKGKIKLVYLCSPNNPTGESIPKDNILEICKQLMGKAVIILDEAYVEFSKQGSLVPFLDQYPNLIILRTLSKAYSLAGIRLGVTLSSDANFISLMKSKVMDAYPLPKPTINAALHALSEDNLKVIKKNIATLLEERDRIKDHIKKYDFVEKIYHSDANFILIKMKNAHDFYQFCLKNNFVIRDFSSKPDTTDCLRISPSTPENNDRFLSLFDEYLESKK